MSAGRLPPICTAIARRMRISASLPSAVYKNRGSTDAKQRFYRGETEALSKRNRASNRDETKVPTR
ncbi:hypothetical protein HMPREF1981_02649 [Bacteroides pyogenes F0041]|uniref:Uncharacterized protein n=1 Tax=Bacteroides pyogenes F0041 TaxID=1321819 RepID=U2DQZ4_9BACE|nr:hypothetical protein HMPREF1981_02649 [Bacteroides pyogenes F0041]GAE23227.1 hypothetical protein JCM10003_2952 [Bacteroides pyogenes JCM 10003]